MRKTSHSNSHLNESVYPIGGSAIALVTLLLLI